MSSPTPAMQKTGLTARITTDASGNKHMHVVSIGITSDWARWSTWKLTGDSGETWQHSPISVADSSAPRQLAPSIAFPAFAQEEQQSIPADQLGFCAVSAENGEVYHVRRTDDLTWRCQRITAPRTNPDAAELLIYWSFYIWENKFNLLALYGSNWTNYSWENDTILGKRVSFASSAENGLSHVTCAGNISPLFVNESMHFFFRGTNGMIYDCVRTGAEWTLVCITSEALRGRSVTSVRPSASDLSVILVDQIIHIFFVGIDNRLRELYKAPDRSWRHVSLRRHVGGSVCSLPEQCQPFACADAEKSIHLFFLNDEKRIGECYWKLKRSKWRVYDTSDYIPRHGLISRIFDVTADEGPHLFFESADGTSRMATYHHVHWTDNNWVSAYWGTREGIQLDNDPPGTPSLLEAHVATSSNSEGVPAPPLPPPPPCPPPPKKIVIERVTAALKPPLFVRLPMHDGSYRSKLHKYKSVRLVIVSDTHNYPERVGELPPGDILVHCGDFTVYGKGPEISDFANWLDQQTQFKHKVVIAGNHEVNAAKAKKLLEPHCVWLDNKLVSLLGINFYGTTWGCDYSLLPTKGVDVLLTHRPPSGHGDVIYTGDSRGSETLANAVRNMKPILHAFGHNHEGFGATCDSHTVYVNAATCMGSAKSSARRGTIVVDIYPDLKSKYGSSRSLSSEELSSSSSDWLTSD